MNDVSAVQVLLPELSLTLGQVEPLLHQTALTSVPPALVPASATPIAAPVLVLPLFACSPSPGSAISNHCQLKKKKARDVRDVRALAWPTTREGYQPISRYVIPKFQDASDEGAACSLR